MRASTTQDAPRVEAKPRRDNEAAKAYLAQVSNDIRLDAIKLDPGHAGGGGWPAGDSGWRPQNTGLTYTVSSTTAPATYTSAADILPKTQS